MTEDPSIQPIPTSAVFISYASQDADAAARICAALREAGVEVWFDQSELRGGDAWDRQIRDRIHDCRLFIAVISARSEIRDEGYFRREWKLAVDRTNDMAEDRAFLVPVAIDNTSERGARVPESFKHVQWTRLPGGQTPPAFVARVSALLGTSAPASAASGPSPAPASAAPARQRRRRALGIAVGAVLLVIACGVLWHFARIPREPVTPHLAEIKGAPASFSPPPHSIAVLPFADMSEKHDQEYLSDGMAEEIIGRLARVPALHVPARTSSFYFKGKSTKISDIARELGVVYVLEGSVRKSGNHLRIGAQLVRADNGYQTWSESYDRDLKDVFAIQDEIATAVATALQITLTGGPLTRRNGGTRNLDAYQAYLRAAIDLSKNTTSGFTEGRQQLEHAVKLDPTFGLAWAGLANVWVAMADRGDVSPEVGSERARQIAAHAIDLSPDLADAHAILAYVYRTYDWNWDAAKSELDRALAIDPRNQQSLMSAGMLAQTLGKHDDAVRLLGAALARDPLWSWGHFNYGNALYLSGRYAQAEAAFRKVLVIAPDFTWTRPYLAKTLLAEHKPREALETLQAADLPGIGLMYWPIMLLANNRTAEANAALQEEKSKYAKDYAFYVAQVYAYRDEKNLAMQWLERAYAQKDTGLIEILGEPLLRNLCADPRYKAFLRKMNLPET